MPEIENYSGIRTPSANDKAIFDAEQAAYQKEYGTSQPDLTPDQLNLTPAQLKAAGLEPVTTQVTGGGQDGPMQGGQVVGYNKTISKGGDGTYDVYAMYGPDGKFIAYGGGQRSLNIGQDFAKAAVMALGAVAGGDALTGAFGGAGTAAGLGGEGSFGVTSTDMLAGAGSGGVDLSAAGASAVNNPSAWSAGLPTGGASGAVSPIAAGFDGMDFIPQAQSFNSAPAVIEPTAVTPDVPSITPQTSAYTNPTGASEIASQNAATNAVPSYTNPTGASEVASQSAGTSLPSAPAASAPTTAAPQSAMQTIANTPTSTGVELGNSAQTTFRAGEIGAQSAGAGALGMFGTPIMPGAEGVAGQLFEAAKTAGTDVASWIKANPSAATMIFSSLVGASNAQATKEAATIQAQSALDQINQTNANLNTNRAANGAAIAGLRMPGLINSKPLMRSDGVTKVFGANGLINRG